jgi:iron(III) transport system substrate-binding protein
VQVRYGETAELAATILEEGENSPADLFFAQDPGALGALDDEGRLTKLPEEILGRVPAEFKADDGDWVGTSGRSRVVAYNTEELQEGDLPDSVFGFTDPEWEGRLGWAPTNGSFQAFVTALRVLEGEDRAREWLEGVQANDPFVYPDNLSAVEGVASGEVEVALVNHYYLFQVKEERGQDLPAANHFFDGGDPGALVLAAGAGVLDTAENPGGGAGVPGVRALRRGPAVLRRRDLRVPAGRGGRGRRGAAPDIRAAEPRGGPEQPRRPRRHARAPAGDGGSLG